LVARDVREQGQIQLTTALNALARREEYLALETKGTRHNLGVKYGFVETQIALALAGVDRERMLAELLESIVRIEQHNGPASPAP
ncbi:UTP--glucose-1-phosphate uridylyltransferase, partial [Singulisphaera rosea]